MICAIRVGLVAAVSISQVSAWTVAWTAEEGTDESKLSLERIFQEDDYSEESFGPARWLPDSSGYVIVEASEGEAGGRDFVRYTPGETEGRVLVHSRHLIPSGETKPLSIDDYSWSHDGAYLLIFTNSRRVWRANTRGDYWIFDVTSHELRQLGGEALPSTLMFATGMVSMSRLR